MNRPRNLVLLGATGSIGASALRIVRAHPDRLRLLAVAAQSRAPEISAIVREFRVPHAALADAGAFAQARHDGLLDPAASWEAGTGALERLAALPEADLILVAVVGTAGLAPTLAAIRAGKTVALANKEVLVMAGQWVMAEAERHGTCILPADSEHNAIFQCLDGRTGGPGAIARLILTASGGAFRDRPLDTLDSVTPAEALRHPNWDMGPKVTLDSATMANKGLELIEARWLFGLPPERLDVVLHPQSIVHSLVQFTDGTHLAQLSPPSMTFPLQHCLLYPDRPPGVEPPLDFGRPLHLAFAPPDPARYPCLGLARAALAAAGAAPCAFNAANEVAVAAFLSGRLRFTQISALVDKTLARFSFPSPAGLPDILAADELARRLAVDTMTSFS